MNMVIDIKPISFVKANAASIIEQINETRRPLIVTQNGEARAVIVDPVSYQNLTDGIKMMKLLSQSETELLKGNRIGQSELFTRMEKKLK